MSAVDVRRVRHGPAAGPGAAVARWSSERFVWRVVVGVAAAYALAVATLALLRYEAFASDFDHGIFTQYVWLLGHFDEPFNTVVLRTLLGDHVEPGIALLAPLGALGVAAPGILVAQTLALAVTAPLLYLLARQHGARGWVAAVPALLWCASPVVLHPALVDFHPEALVPMLLAAGCLALERRRTGWFVASVVVACAMKEDIGLTYAVLGLVLAWEGRRRLGGILAAVAGVYSVLAVYVVLPAFGTAAEQEFAPRFAGGRGDSFLDVVRYTVVHPFTTIQETFTLEDLGIVLLLILTTGGFCLLAPRWMLLAVPAAALNVFSAYELQHTIDYQYWIVAAGAVALAGAVGAGRVGASGRPMWLGWSTAAGVVLALLTLQWSVAILRQARAEWPRRADRQAIVDAVPAGASVSAPMQMLAHVAGRKRLYVLPEPMIAVRFGVKDGIDREQLSRELEYAISDAHMRPWGPLTMPEVEQLLERRGFREVMRRGDTVLYRKAPEP